jgi:hypothetical protein
VSVSASAIVGKMETMPTVASADQSAQGPGVNASVDPTPDRSPSNGPIIFWRDGAASPNLGNTFAHEILHTIYSGVGVPNGGWANPSNNHQDSFNEAAKSIQ